MGSHATLPHLREIIVFLIAAGVMVPLFHRIKVSPVLGYLVLGGLIDDQVTESEQKVPLLGDIPLLGALFTSRNVQKEKRNLLNFIRPTILRGDVTFEDGEATGAFTEGFSPKSLGDAVMKQGRAIERG